MSIAPSKILEMSPIQQIIINANLPFHSKIHILSTLLDISYLFDNATKKRYAGALNNMLSFASSERNVIAHCIFTTSKDSDGVKFFVFRARGSLRTLKFDWSVDRFEQAIAGLQQCGYTVRVMAENFTISKGSLAAILASIIPPAPTPPQI